MRFGEKNAVCKAQFESPSWGSEVLQRFGLHDDGASSTRISKSSTTGGDTWLDTPRSQTHLQRQIDLNFSIVRKWNDVECKSEYSFHWIAVCSTMMPARCIGFWLQDKHANEGSWKLGHIILHLHYILHNSHFLVKRPSLGACRIMYIICWRFTLGFWPSHELRVFGQYSFLFGTLSVYTLSIGQGLGMLLRWQIRWCCAYLEV